MLRILRDPRLGIAYLAARLWVGWMFIDAGWEKLTGGGWLGSTAGIDGYLGFAGSKTATAGAHPAVGGWYAWLVNHAFLHADHVLAVVVPFGELFVGLGLVLGVFTLGAAFFGALLNLQFMLSGSLSGGDNPLMFGLGVLLLVAGSASYVYGFDRVLLPRLRRLLGLRGGTVAAEPVLDVESRGIRAAVGAALVLVAWHFGFAGVDGIGALVVAALALATAAVGFSPANRALRTAQA